MSRLITEIHYGNRLFHLRGSNVPILKVARRNPNYWGDAPGHPEVNCEALDMCVKGSVEADVLADFAEEFAMVYDEYGLADDTALTLDGQRLKKAVNEMVESVEEVEE